MSGLTTEDTESTEASTWAAEAAGLLTVLGSYQSGALGEQIEACLARYQELKRQEAGK